MASAWLSPEILKNIGPDDIEAVKALGQRALESGQISPEDAQAHADDLMSQLRAPASTPKPKVGIPDLLRMPTPQKAGADNIIGKLMNLGISQIPKMPQNRMRKPAPQVPKETFLPPTDPAGTPVPTRSPLMPGKPTGAPDAQTAAQLAAAEILKKKTEPIPDEQMQNVDLGKLGTISEPATNAPNGLGAYSEAKKKADELNKKTTVSNTMLKPEEYDAAATNIRNQPEFKDALAGLDDDNGMLKLMASVPRANADSWLKPVAALTDSLVPNSKLLQGLPTEDKNSKRMEEILKYGDKIQSRRTDLAKLLTEGIAKQKSGTVTDLLQTQLMDQMMQGRKPTTEAVDKQTLQNERLDRADHRQTVQIIQRDPGLRQQVISLNQLRMGMQLLSDGETDPKKLAEAQVMIRGAIQSAGGARSVGEERLGTYVKNAGVDWDTLMQYLSNDMQYMKPGDPVLKHLASLGNEAAGTLTTQMMRLLKAKAGGHASVYDRNPDLAYDLQDLLDSMSNVGNPSGSMTSDKVGAVSLPKAAAKTGGKHASGGMVKMKAPDGRTFNIPAKNKEAAIKRGLTPA